LETRAVVHRGARVATTLVLLLLANATAQARGPHRFNHVDFDDGLPGSYVTSLLQRADGFVWIGTDAGVVRYDGYEFRHQQYEADNPASLSNSWIRDLESDGSGRLWIATDQGLNRLHEDENGFDRFLHDPADPHTLPDDKVLGLYRDREGALWVGTTGGMARHDRASDRFERFVPPAAGAAPRQAVRAMLEDTQGRFWVGTHRGLLRFERALGRFEAVHTGDATLDARLDSGYIARLLEDHRGTVWIAMDGDGGLIGLEATGRWRLLRHDPADPNSLPSNNVWSLAEDREQRLWVGTWGEGLALLDAPREQFTNYRANETDEFALPSDTVNDVLVDAAGVVWLATGTAAAIVNPNSETIRQFAHLPGDPASLPHRHVWALSAAPDGAVWVGTESGIARIARDGESLQAFPARAGGSPDAGDGIVWAMAPDEHGGVWLGTDAGLDHFEPSTQRTQHFHGLPDSGQPLSQASYAVARGESGEIWAAEEGVGLHRFDAEGRLLETLGLEQGLPNLHLNRAWSAGPQRIWFGSTGGLFAFEPRARRFHRVARGADAALLARVTVNALSWDATRGSLWVATDDQGLFEIDPGPTPADAAVRSRLRVGDGLPAARVFAAQADDAGRLWVTTPAGLSRYESGSRNWTHLGAINERRKFMFLEGAAARTADGALLFGGTRGVIRFAPDAIRRADFAPALRFAAVVLRDARGERRLDGRIPARIEVEHDFHAVELRAAALDFAASPRNRYRYRVYGRDADWVDLGTDRRVVLRDLAPGRYRVVVQGTNRDGVWSPHEVGIELRVRPPVWQRPEAYALYALLAMLLLAGLLAFWRRRAAVIARVAASERRLSGALWGSGDELWDYNVASGEVVRSNLLAVLPPPGPGSRGTLESLLAAVHPDDQPQLRSALDRLLAGETGEYEALYRLPDRHGGWAWVLDRGKISERGADGRPARVVGTLRDVTGIMQTEERLSLVASALEQSTDGAIIADLRGRLVYFNSAAERYLARPGVELRGTALDASAFRHLQTPEGVDEIARFEAARQAGRSYVAEFECDLDDGTRVPLAVRSSAIHDRQGKLTHYVTFFVDISYRKQTENELRRLAKFDALTGLPNRSLFLDRLEHALAQARRGGRRLALLFIDLDNFKHVNDSLGHAAGDELLRAVAARLQSGTRSADTVARLGGDEFTVIVEDPADDAAVATVAHKLIESLAREFVIVGQRVRVSPSIGIALSPEHGSASDELLMHSDIAMYHAKAEGRNNFQFYRPEMNARVLERIALEGKLRAALADDTLELHYQPKFCTETARITGLEALLRWNDPVEGMIPPSRFIPVAEESGLIVELGHWVLRRACTQAAAWLARGLDPGSVAVNLSARQFRDRDLIGDIREVLHACGLAAQRLELEITESTLAADIEYAIQVLGGLRALGVRLALDDFGTGYSSLSYLRRFPIHTLKLDRSFLRDVPANAQDSRLVESIIRLAHDLDVSVTAEGIEQPAQREFLRGCGCEELQGYLFARPLPVAEVEQLLRGERE
jgi:diguanylate cyclase (GGDEF)-like protein/PAS domain S-box-containing protein